MPRTLYSTYRRHLAAYPQHRHPGTRRDNWRKPKALVAQLEDEFGKLFDPCPAFPQFDGLTIAWRTRTFVNCPFDNKLAWLVKALAERELGKLVVMLLPVDTSTQWSRRYVMRAQEIRFIEGHLRFDDGPTEAPGASCVVVFRPGVRATLAPIVSSLVTMPSTSQEGDDK